jgi:hypothetical protein
MPRKAKEIDFKKIEKEARKHPAFNLAEERLKQFYNVELPDMERYSIKSYLKGLSSPDPDSDLSKYIRIKVAEAPPIEKDVPPQLEDSDTYGEEE